ncbi:unnamed protein product [Leptidea sinapis]|uniref:Major facilitator superfamily (MFS) profile domain-containing protein n=1 Tax=Leptidea sinapis TaxID=189913 RepID=A0A5E4Q1B5_9NEOP|nr:unnamed protein product [Leptidea sinapis]
MSAAAPIRQPETADEANEKLLEKGLIPAVQKESISAKSSKKVKLPEDEEPKVGKFTIGPAPVRDWEMVPPDGKWGWCILVGPLSSILSVKWSYRTVTLIGGSFAAFGMIFSSWAFSIGYLYVRGAVLILGGIMLNVWAAALLFQPVEEHMVKKYKEVEEDEVPQDDILFEEEEPIESFNMIEPEKQNGQPDAGKQMSTRNLSQALIHNSQSCMHSSQNLRHNASKRKLSTARPVTKATLSSASMALDGIPDGRRLGSQETFGRRLSTTKRNLSTTSFAYVSTPFHGSTLSAFEQPNEFASQFSLKSITDSVADVAYCCFCCKKKQRKPNKFFDVSLLTDPAYLIIMLGGSSVAISVTNFIILLPSFAQNIGIDKSQGALLLSTVSALDLVGRIGGSTLCDLNIMPKSFYFVGGLLFSGIILAFIPTMQTYTMISIACALFGLFSGINNGYMSTPFHGSTLSAFEKPSEFASQFSLKSITESLAPISYCCGCKKRKADDTNKEPNKYFDIELLKDPIYLVILISNSTCAISYTNFIILVPSYAQELGFDKTLGAYLLSIISALDLVGRIGGSALSDVVTTPKRYFFITGLLLSGISLSLMPLVNSYSAISAFCCVFGLASGINVGVTALVMTEMLGTERLMSSYGISLFVNGILQLIGPPVCGIWYENTKSYKSLFVTLGIILVFGASLWSVVPMILRKRKQKENAVSA